ncbi:diguanylate cyclase [Xanthobacter sp. AM11]|uniref:sensor domain-containing diguanylate cyclase n=1 Tax=Xanthobacter sp. AM11 TaxID=3380643 RepID=UPI0039BFD43C
MSNIATRLVREPSLRIVTTFMIVVILLVQGFMLLWSWSETRTDGIHAAQNALNVISHDIERNLSILDLFLLSAAEGLNMPELQQVSPVVRHRILFDRAMSASFLGAVLVVDAHGDISFDSSFIEARQLNLADRDYFQAQKAADRGPFVSEPFKSRLSAGDERIALSRRLSGPDGAFDGIVVGTIRLQYFMSLFKDVQLGRDSLLILLRPDGTLLVRDPPAPREGIANYASFAIFRKIAAGAPQPFVGRSQLDGITRIFVYHKFRDFPVALAVGISVPALFETWLPRAIITGTLTIAVCLLLGYTVWVLGSTLRQSHELRRQLEGLAVTDPLTALPNRRAFDAMVDAELRRAARERQQLSLLMIDVDHFKRVNDTFGHETGDTVLRQLAQIIQRSIRRPGDFAARYGGEEFVVLLPATDAGGALRIAESIRSTIAAAAFPTTGGEVARVTASIGVATARHGEVAASLVRHADEALYRAKGQGRNRVAGSEADAPHKPAPPLAAQAVAPGARPGSA